MSPYLFILALEILFIQVRGDSSIKGFRIKQFEIKLTAYADDATFFVKDAQSPRKILKLLKKFEEFSSLRINVERCEACWIRRAKNRNTKPVKCKWTSLTKSSIKILGICFTLLNIWKQRWLSLAGKIQVFKSLVASKPVYLATMIPVPQNFCDTLKASHEDFIWSGKAKIKHSTLIGDCCEGGLRDVDIDAKLLSLKFIWIKRLKDPNSHPWKVVANQLLSQVEGVAIFHTNLCLSDNFKQQTNKLPLFYKELIIVWEKMSKFENMNSSNILAQSLWNNKFVKVKSKSLYTMSLVRKGIKTVIDLVDIEGSIKNWETISREFNLHPIHFLEWYGVCNSIPNKWKRTVKGYLSNSSDSTVLTCNVLSGIEVDGKFASVEKVSAKTVYQMVVKRKFSKPTSQKFFTKKFDISFQNIWRSVYLLSGQASIESKIRMFQYKILNNVLYLTQRFSDMNIVGSSLCSQYKKEPETISHLFLNCTFSQKLRSNTQKWCSPIFKLPNLSEKIVFLGYLNEETNNILINHIILLYKYFIYSKRDNPGGTNFKAFLKAFIRNINKTEKFIAKKITNCRCTFVNGTIYGASNMKKYFAAENLWGKNCIST